MTESILRTTMTMSSICAVFFNLSLLPLISLRSGKEMGSYKYLLLLYTTVAAVNAAALMIVRPLFYPTEFGWLMYATTQRISRDLGSYFILIFSVCYIVLALVLTYSFIYRYFALCRPTDLRWFKEPKRIMVLAAIPIVVLFITAVPAIIYMRLHPYMEEHITELNLHEVSYIGSPVFINGTLVPETMFILVTYTVVVDCCGAIIVFCIVKIVQFFRSYTTTLNPRTRTQQKRLFTLLVLQTLVPVSFAFFPCLISYALAVLQKRGSAVSPVYSAFLPLAQLFEPILIISFVTEYRNAIWKIFTFRIFELAASHRLNFFKNYVGTLATTSTATVRNEPVFAAP